MEALTGFDQLGDRDGVVVAYPDALNGTWNQAPAIMGSVPDDVGFINGLIDHLANAGCIDRTKVFAAGFSNGGGMTYRLACDSATTLTAIGLVSTDYLGSSDCKRSAPIAVFALHGKADTTMPLAGVTYGTSVHPSVLVWASGWAAANGCQPTPATRDTSTATRLSWTTRCSGGASVTLTEINRGTHEWFRGDSDATQSIWTFLRGQGL
jgi:polyhydroxybutyrate depolymerase